MKLEWLVLRALIALFVLFWPHSAYLQNSPNEPIFSSLIKLSEDEKQWLAQNQKIRIGGGKDWMPFDFFDDNDRYQGIANDFLDNISAISGLQFEVSKATWAENLQALERGEIHLLPAVYKNEERNTKFLFSSAYASTIDYFFIHQSINAKSLADLDSKTIAIPKDFASIALIRKQFPNINILEVDTLSSAIKAVEARQADILYDTYSVLKYKIALAGIDDIIPFRSIQDFSRQSLHFATTPENKHLISILNKSLDLIDNKQRQEILERWLVSDSKPNRVQLSDELLDWIGKNPVIRYGAERDWAPYDFINSEGLHDGLSKDYLDLISEHTGLSFIPVEGDWAQLIKEAKQEKIDLLPTLYKSPEREAFLDFSVPYQSMLDYFFVREDLSVKSIDDLAGKIVAIPVGFVLASKVAQNYPDIEILEVPSLTEAVQAVLEGKADLLADSYAVLNFYLRKNNITSIVPFQSLSVDVERELHMASIRSKPELTHIINEVLSQVDATELSKIKSKWLTYQNTVLASSVGLSTIEKNWVFNNPIVTIGSYSDFLPIEGQDNQGEIIGLSKDLISLAAQKVGLNITFKRVDNLDEALLLMEQGPIHAVSTSYPRIFDLSYARSIHSSPLVIITKQSNTAIQYVEQISDKRIAVVKGADYLATFVTENINYQYQFYESVESALMGVSLGEADLALAPLSHASYYIADLQLHNLKVTGTTDVNVEQLIAVSGRSYPLASILSKGLHAISPLEKQTILNRWVVPNVIEKIQYTLLIQIAIPLLLIILVIVIWNNRLKNEVKRRKEIQLQTKMLLNHVPQQILVTDLKGNVLSANQKALDDNQISADEAKNINVNNIYVNNSDRRRLFQQIKQQGDVEQLVLPVRWLTGEIHSMMLSITPTTYKRKPALLTIAVDMTERIQIESELKEAKRRADLANQSKSDFLANMSHEIRTPMNAIIGFTELLQQQINDPKLEGFVRTIKSAGHSLLTLINDILDLSKVEAGQIELFYSATDVHQLFEEISNVFLMKVKHKQIDLILRVDEAIPATLKLDKARLRQVLFNLVGNAVKFTDKGKVELIIRHRAAESGKSDAVDLFIDVVDTGIGIPKDDQILIFQNFYQHGGQSLSKYGGTGLGLTISQRLVELMGGKISLESELNKGSCFTVHLFDIEVSTEHTKPDVSKTVSYHSLDFDATNLLIVDDVEHNRDLIAEICQGTNISCMSAKNGREAIEIVKESKIDVILMDIRMPEMDGYEAAEIISQLKPDIPIIALTASVMRDDYERQRRKNFVAYLRKPVLQQELMNELSKYIGHRAIDTSSQKSVPINKGLSLKDSKLQSEYSLRFNQQCLRLQKTNAIKEIKEFGLSIKTWAEMNNEENLIAFADKLIDAANIFDIGAIKHLLHECELSFDD